MPKKSRDDLDYEAACAVTAFFWAVIVMNPRGWQSLRHTYAKLGIIKPKGKLALTARGERIMKISRRPDKGERHE